MKTLFTTSVHRDYAGASNSNAAIAKILQLPTLESTFPHSAIGINALLDIVQRNPIYHDRLRTGRILVGLAILAQLVPSKVVIQNFKNITARMLRAAIGHRGYQRLRDRLRLF